MNTPVFLRLTFLAPVFSQYACDKPYDSLDRVPHASAYSSLTEVTSIDQTPTPVEPPLPTDYPDLSKPSDLPDPPQAVGASNQKVSVDESPSPPNSIMGALLRCYLEEARKEVAVEMGCRFQGEDDERVSVNKIAKKIVFATPVVLTAGITQRLKTLKSNSKYDVVFRFSGAPIKDLKSAALSALYVVNLYDLENGDSQGLINAEGSSLVVPSLNSSWQRELATDDNGDGKCQSDEICHYQGLKLLWTRDEGEELQYFEAAALCDNLDDGNQGWRLPFLNEWQEAYVRHINALSSRNSLNIQPSHYWSARFDSNDYAAFNVFSGQTLYLAPSESASVVCVKKLADY